jgi:hypothetical protein
VTPAQNVTVTVDRFPGSSGGRDNGKLLLCKEFDIGDGSVRKNGTAPGSVRQFSPILEGSAAPSGSPAAHRVTDDRRMTAPQKGVES